ncbi:DUF6266 family protein [Flavobacterium sp. PLA-1-15]|uniref:DUF6266 family protein n=1 Tax=Flavobacterium sp. PLA-1-15 TaxID=3380533 RepID=UPI003B7CAE91
MGTYEQGILGAFSGLVGPVVGSSFRGKSVMRGRPRKSKKLPTPAQLAQRERFSAVTRFMTPAREILSQFFGMPSGSRSRYNMATSYYLQEAVATVGAEAVILYHKALFSKGTLLQPQNLEAEAVGSKRLELKWQDNSEQGNAKIDDRLLVVLFEPETELYEFFLGAGTRARGEAVLNLPGYLVGQNVECWAFMVSNDNVLKSTSQYLGKHLIS